MYKRSLSNKSVRTIFSKIQQFASYTQKDVLHKIYSRYSLQSNKGRVLLSKITNLFAISLIMRGNYVIFKTFLPNIRSQMGVLPACTKDCKYKK